MKKAKLLSIIQENTEGSKTYLSNMNEDSFYDGYKFVEYGKNIQNISLIMPSTDTEDFSVDKEKVVINWGAKFEFRNSGIEGVQVTVLNIQAPIVSSGEGEARQIPMNYGEFKFEVSKEKNIESQDIQLFISAIEIDVENRIVNVVVTI